jgi:hypothetical protein
MKVESFHVKNLHKNMIQACFEKTHPAVLFVYVCGFSWKIVLKTMNRINKLKHRFEKNN